MYLIWVTRGLYSSMITMFTSVYDKENGHQQDDSWYVYIFTDNAFEEAAQITILSELSYFAIIKFRILLSYMCHG